MILANGRPGASYVILKWLFDEEGKKKDLKATTPEDMLELFNQNLRLRKLIKDYLTRLLIFEVTGPEDEVTQSKECQHHCLRPGEGFWLSP